MAEQMDRSPVSNKSEWQTPALHYDGDLRELVLGGGGKLSITGGDPGEGLKPRGGG